MTRRQLLSLPFAAPALCADAPSFPGVAYRDYARCLPDYLRSLAREAYQLRNRRLSALTSAAAVRRHQEWARETFWKLVGGMPERTPLEVQTTGSFERPGYRVEKLVYQSRPNFYVAANLYIPANGNPPYPGVLFQMGHTLNGKAGDTYQRCCQGLVKLGYLVLAFDPMGQGERTYYPDSTGHRTRLPSADHEHTTPGRQMLLTGDTATRLQVWDAVRSLDYLAAHPLVDPKRLASTGQSGGGTVTMLLLAVEDRLATAVVCSGNTENFANAHFNPPGSTDDAEQNLIASGRAGFDRWDLLYPFAPKPLLITVSDKDFFGTYSPQYVSSGWEEFQKLKRVYAVLGAPGHLAWADTPLPHGLSYDSRLHVYNWFARHLKGESGRVEEEPPVSPEADEVLWATREGSTLGSLHSETPFSMNRARARSLKRTSVALKELLRIEVPAAASAPSVLRRVPSSGVRIEAIEAQSDPGVWLPAWLFLPHSPPGAATKPVLLFLDPAGRNVRWHEGELYQLLAQRGYPVCAADLRGVGDLTPEVGRGAARYNLSHGGEEYYAWASLILGRPLLTQRVADILALTAALRRHPSLSGRPIRVAALRRMTVPALLAAALDSHIEALYLAEGLISYARIVETEEYNHPLSNFLPGVLEHTDLPDLAAAIAPRSIRLAGPLDASGNAVEAASIHALYGQKPHITVTTRPQWDLETFAAWAG